VALIAVPDVSLKIEEIGPQHIQPYAELSFAEYGSAPIADVSHLRWKFLENPQGSSLGIHLFAADRLVGRLAAQPRTFVFPDGNRRTAAYMVDLLIHPDFRGIGSLMKIMGGMRTLRERFDFAIVTPNDKGIQVWRDLAKLRPEFDLGVSAAVLRPGNFPAVSRRAGSLAGILNRVWLAAASGASNIFSGAFSFDRAWPDAEELGLLLAPSTRRIHGRRDPEFLQWRFKSSPVFKYEVNFVRMGGRLIGYVVTRRATVAGYCCCFVVDAFATESCSQSMWRRIRWEILRLETLGGGADMAMVLGNESCGALAHVADFPFIRVPERFLPQRTPVFVDYWAKSMRVIDEREMELTLADCDMI
jgi:hypothetical protein